jgi:hypothetical protein
VAQNVSARHRSVNQRECARTDLKAAVLPRGDKTRACKASGAPELN